MRSMIALAIGDLVEGMMFFPELGCSGDQDSRPLLEERRSPSLS